MTHPDTHALLERLLLADQRREYKRLVSYARRFDSGSRNPQHAVFDAEHVVQQALESILEKGDLHTHPKPMAYIYLAIKRKAADENKTGARRARREGRASTPEVSREVTDLDDDIVSRVNRAGHNAAIADAVTQLDGRARAVAEAKIANPGLNKNGIADLLNVSRDTVRRAYEDLHANPVLRMLAADDDLVPPPDLEQP